MSQPSTTPASRSLLPILLPWLMFMMVSAMSWKFYTAFKASNALANESMDKEKAIGEYLGNLVEEAKANISKLESDKSTMAKQLSDAEATTASWREQFNTLGLSLADSEQARQELAKKLAEASKGSPQASN